MTLLAYGEHANALPPPCHEVGHHVLLTQGAVAYAPASRPVTPALALSRTTSSKSVHDTGSSCRRAVRMLFLHPMAASITAGVKT
ncbi:hypothetical protein RAA17_04320 [Komagataeibacter rhaeticus]|nr:hypothetical protein [Komagataeibacter rhaeticus]